MLRKLCMAVFVRCSYSPRIRGWNSGAKSTKGFIIGQGMAGIAIHLCPVELCTVVPSADNVVSSTLRYIQ